MSQLQDLLTVNVVSIKRCNQCLDYLNADCFYRGDNKCKKCVSFNKKQTCKNRKELFQQGLLQHPRLSYCGHCKQLLPSKYFDYSYSRNTGLQHVCKYHKAMYNIMNKAKRKKVDGIDQLMTRNQFFKMLNSSCFYCGSSDQMSVDRIDSTGGYTRENCIPCCHTCNFLKGKLSITQFLSQCKKISDQQRRITVQHM